MLFFLVSCLSFLMLSQSFLKPFPASRVETRRWEFPWVFWEALHIFFVFVGRKGRISIRVLQVPNFFPSSKRIFSSKFQVVEEVAEEKEEFSLLDLPDLALDCILEKLLPAELCSMASVCSSLRERCTSDHLWEKLIKQKWGGVIGHAAFREWQSQMASKRAPKFLHCRAERSKFQFFSVLSKFVGYKSEMKRIRDSKCQTPLNSVMSCYLALESGKFWFPAQVFNRENGHVGFMLSCYDAQLSYDSTVDNFVARYPAKGRSSIEEGIEWNRLRAPAVDTPANVLLVSDCLDELKPDDHIEIQWRKNREFPYGWWYGVVGHLESCGGNQFNCQCHINDTVILEFKQYSPGSRWRRVTISRKSHREVGNDAVGFYGGIRKLYQKEEIAEWKHFWPNCTLE